MIDWTRVARLREELGDEDFAEVADLFLEEVDEVVDRMHAAQGPEQLAADLHFLRGSALNLGFRDLAQLCAEGEGGAATPPAAFLQRLTACYAESRQLFLENAAVRDVA